MESVVAHTLSLVLPPMLQKAFVTDLLDSVSGKRVKVKLPSAASIARYEVSLDVALLYRHRDKAAQGDF